MVLTNIKRDVLVSALKKNNDLDAHAPVVFGIDLQTFVDHGYEILLFYKTVVLGLLNLGWSCG